MQSEPRWWQTGVVYEIYPRSFADANGDGVGDLAGIRSRLEYLAWLGVDAIWIAPFYPSPMADFGYDVADHAGVDPLFGSLDDFDALIGEAHRLGIRVITDFVPNHTSERHAWFAESRASRDNPKRDWYVWRDPRPDGSPPNNWISMFGGPAWEWDDATGQYYLHSFLRQQPDLDWRNPDVRAAMLDVLRFWLDRGVDGFRIDVAQFVAKDPELRDNPPNPEPERLAHLGEWRHQLHLHDHGHPDLHPIYREIRRLLDSYPGDRVIIGELHHPDFDVWAGFYGEVLDEIHLPFNFHFLQAPWDADALRSVIGSVCAALRDGAFANWVLGNHDQPRIASRIGRAQARVAMMLLMTLRGAPTLYYGEEIGMVNVDLPADRLRDPWGLREPAQGRDPQRTPMPWDGSGNAGFCPPGVEPWLPLGADVSSVNVAAQRNDPASMLSLTRRLLHLRRAHPALADGDLAIVDGVPHGVLAFHRGRKPGRVLVALNLTNEQQMLRDVGQGDVLVGTHPDRDDAPVDGSLELRPDEAVVVELP